MTTTTTGTTTGSDRGDRGTAPPPAPGRGWSRDRVETLVFGVLRWVVIAFLLLITLFPFYYTVVLSVSDLSSVLQEPGRLWPRSVSLDPYAQVLRSVADGGQGFLTLMRNSLLIALGTVVLTLLFAIPGAYAVSRLAFPGRRQVSVLFLTVYLFPSILLAVPLFVVFSRIGLRASLIGLVIVYVSQTVAVSIYMLRNYFDTIPVSIEEAAAVDGASRFHIMRKVSLPLAMPAIMANALFIFMIAWNEFLFALLFLVEDRSR